MSSRSLLGSPEAGGDMPTFTCEVCKISVRSAQKLLDHVNFSPLHKAALEGDNPNSLSHSRSGQRSLLYDGTKLFWRINETLELGIYEDTGLNCINIMAAPQDPQEHDQAKPMPQLLLDRRSVLRAAGADIEHHPSGGSKAKPMSHHHHNHHSIGSHHQPHAALAPEVITKYLLARLQAKRTGGGSLALFLQKLKDDEFEPLVLAQSHHLTAPPSDLAIRRRHTYDEVKATQKEVKQATVELKKAREQAETLSNMARVTLEAFSKRTPTGSGTPQKSEWLRTYDRFQFKNAVEHSKDILSRSKS